MTFPSIVPAPHELDARFTRLLRRAQQLPPPGSRPLTVAARVAGWVAPRAVEAVAGLPGVHVEDEAVHITAALRQGLNLDAVLRGIAEALRAAQCLRAWRDELLDVIGEGRVLARIERAAVRPLGLLTQAVHLNAWAPDGRLWIARRALDKSTDPGLWDTLSGGLVAAGEDHETALLRESREEAGLRAVEIAGHGPLRMVLRMHRRLPEGYQVENLLLCDCVLDAAVTPVNMDGEVCEIRCVAVAELWEMLGHGAFTLEAELAILDSLRMRTAGASPAAPLK
uniref:NUDIX hydrolase n=1 Tax=Castellaniella defragrans TaxID=75697 RepID=UPI0033413BDD